MANNNNNNLMLSSEDSSMDFLFDEDDDDFEFDENEKTIFSSDDEVDEPPANEETPIFSGESMPSAPAMNSENSKSLDSKRDEEEDEHRAEDSPILESEEEPITAANSGEDPPSSRVTKSENIEKPITAANSGESPPPSQAMKISRSVDYKRDESGSKVRLIPVSEERIAAANSGECPPSNRAVKSGTKRPCEATLLTESDPKSVEEEEEDEEPITMEDSGSGESPPYNLAVKSVTKKRPCEATISTESEPKRIKTPNSKRVWSEEDEIELLKGMIDFETDSWQKEGFFEAVKKSISFKVTLKQLKDKIRGLKRRYQSKEEKIVKDSSFSRAHEKKCFALSKLIWGKQEERNAIVRKRYDFKANVESKPLLLRRVWSDEDEIAVLKAMVDFETDSWSKEGLYDSVKKAISFKASKMQFKGKVRRLRKRFLLETKNGMDPSSLKDHEKKCFELSKLIWGNSEKVGFLKQESPSPSSNSKKVEDDNTKVSIQESVVESPEHDLLEENGFVVETFVVRLGVNEKHLKRKVSQSPIEDKKRVKGKLKSLQADENECLQRKTDILREVVLYVLARAD
ncbi:unnamed protein product [Cochlearia groenlandica]